MIEGITQAPEKKGFSLFGKKKEEAGSGNSQLIDQVVATSRRLRIIESRYTDLNRKAQVNEKNMLTERKRFIKEIKAIDSDILELKKEFNEIKSKIDTMAAEFKNFAVKEDLESLRKYIEIWEPVNFVTRDEVETIVKEVIEDSK